jgi:hypothetical protein
VRFSNWIFSSSTARYSLNNFMLLLIFFSCGWALPIFCPLWNADVKSRDCSTFCICFDGTTRF